MHYLAMKNKYFQYLQKSVTQQRVVIGYTTLWSLANLELVKLLDVGDKVTVSIIVENGLTVIECGVSLVYDEEEKDTWRNNTEWDLSSFKLSADIYYLCRRDFLKSMEVDGPIPRWFRDLFGYKIDYTGNLFLSNLIFGFLN